MAELTPEIVAEVLAVCQAGAEEAAEAIGRALDAKLSVSVGEPGTIDANTLPEEFSGPGLAVVLIAGEVGALWLLPEASGLVPAWCAEPDATGESKLATLAQELGMILLPEQFMPDDFKTARVKNLAGAIRRGGVADGAAVIELTLSDGEKEGISRLIWPTPKPATVVGSAPPKPTAKPQPTAKAKPPTRPKAAQPQATRRPRNARLRDLPNYARSLLRIKVPVVVTLAEQRQKVNRILEFGPGTIIQFDKSCEDMLDMDAGERRIASGEAVKVGDKFGLRITSIVMPEERFHAVKVGASR